MPGLVTKVTDTIGAAGVMFRAGLVPFPRLDRGLKSIAAVDKYGPFAGPVHAHAENGYDAVAIIDERGPITYAELERQSNALVRAWQADGITSDSVMGAMCRNHRGLVLTMLAAAKNGTKLVLMNTGFARPQLVDVAAREKVVAFVYDDEFAAIADALPDDVVVYRSWPEGTAADGSTAATLDEAIAGRTTSSVPAPEKNGGFVLLTSGTTGTPKGAPRGHTSPLASAQVPRPRAVAPRTDHDDGGPRLPRNRCLAVRSRVGARPDRRHASKVRSGEHDQACRPVQVRQSGRGPDDAHSHHRPRSRRAVQVRHVEPEDHLLGRFVTLARPVQASHGLVRVRPLQPVRIHRGRSGHRRDSRGSDHCAGNRGPRSGDLSRRTVRREQQEDHHPTHDRQDLRRQRAELRGIHRRARQGTYRRTSFDRRRRTLRRQRPPSSSTAATTT